MGHQMSMSTAKKHVEPARMVVDSELQRNGHSVLQVVPIKKKKPGTRLWMRFDATGASEFLELDRNGIMQRSWIPARDLRILGPVFSQSAQILARERAMVVNLEFIKAIVTAEDLYLLDANSTAVRPFVDQLKEQFPLQNSMQVLQEGQQQGHFVDQMKEQISLQIADEEAQLDGSYVDQMKDHFALQPVNRVFQEGQQMDNQIRFDASSPNAPVEWSQNGIMTEEALPDELPFEFRILEIALDVVCSYLESEVTDLELQAYPALDELTRTVTTSNLELVRSLKTQLTHLTARVQKVRDELEQLLDDDEDMADLYLTRKFALGQHIGSPLSLGMGARSTFRFHKASTFNGVVSMASSASVLDLDVEELEMLLEAYFMQLDGTHNKLTMVRQYIDDTEDYVNIQLDHQRNQLFQFQITLATSALALGFATGCYGAFGMNIPIPLFENTHMFKPVVIGGLLASGFIFSSVITYVRWKGLFER